MPRKPNRGAAADPGGAGSVPSSGWVESSTQGGWVWDAGTWLGGALENLQTATSPVQPWPGDNAIVYVVTDVDFESAFPDRPYGECFADKDLADPDVDWILNVYPSPSGVDGYNQDFPPTTFTTAAQAGSHLWVLWFGVTGDPVTDPFPSITDPASIVLASLAANGTA